MCLELQYKRAGQLRLESNVQLVLKGVLFGAESHKLPTLFADASCCSIAHLHDQMSAFPIVNPPCKETASLQQLAHSAAVVTLDHHARPVRGSFSP
jgi:hypothetical protein